MRQSYPGLGFDPTPGEPADVGAFLDGIEHTLGLLDECAGMLRVSLRTGGWVGAASAAFRQTTAVLPTELADTVESMDTAARALRRWLGQLIDNKREADRLDAMARQLLAALEDAEEPAHTELRTRLDATIAEARRLRARHLRQAAAAGAAFDATEVLPGWSAPDTDAVVRTSAEVSAWSARLAMFGAMFGPRLEPAEPPPDLATVPAGGPVPTAMVEVPLGTTRPLPVQVSDDQRAATTAAAAGLQPPGGPVARRHTGRQKTRDRRDLQPERHDAKPGRQGDKPNRRADRLGRHAEPTRANAPGAAPTRAVGDRPRVSSAVTPDADRPAEPRTVTSTSASVDGSQPTREPTERQAHTDRPTNLDRPAARGGLPETGRFMSADPSHRPAPTPAPPPSATRPSPADSDAGDALLLVTSAAFAGTSLDPDAELATARGMRLGTYLLCSGDRQVLVLTEERRNPRGLLVRRSVCLPVSLPVRNAT